jgi:hypothetical protein
VHTLPGRVRYRIPSLKADSGACKAVEGNLVRLEDVTAVAADSRTGTVVVRYQGDRLSPELLFAALVRILGLEKELEKPPDAIVSREIRSLAGSLNRAVFERTGGLLDFSTAAMIVLGAIGAKKFYTERTLPPGFTLLWWTSHALFPRGR